MSTQKAVTDFFRRNRFEATILIAISKNTTCKRKWCFTIYGEQEENFLQTAYMADEIMAPGNTRQCFHGQQAEAEHNDEEQRIKAELLR